MNRHERIQHIITQSQASYNQKFIKAYRDDYGRALEAGMEPWFFVTMSYRDELHFERDELGIRTQRINAGNHGEYLRQYGTFVARKFGTHLELFSSFDSWSWQKERPYPHGHSIVMIDEKPTHKRRIELAKLLENSWQHKDDSGSWRERGEIQISHFEEYRISDSLNYIYLGHGHSINRTFFCGRRECPRKRCDYWKKNRERRQAV